MDINQLLRDATAIGASDVHLKVGNYPVVRVNGQLRPLTTDIRLDHEALVTMAATIMSANQRQRFKDAQELDLAYSVAGLGRFRCNVFQQRGTIGIVLRVIPMGVRTFDELDLPPVLRTIADEQRGLVLVTGTTGSGKSTTLAAMIDHINKTRACHILTIERPIEFVHEPLRAQITQREVGLHASSYAAALRAAGRDNADVVLVSELTTNEEIKVALQLASNGVLVFATTNTNGAAATLDRIVNAFAADEQPHIRGILAESLAGVISQQLLRTSDNKSRVAVHEILVGGSQVSALVREGKVSQLAGVMQAGQAQGMQTLDMALERLVTGNRIAAEAALERAVDKEAFAQVIARVRPDLAELLG